MLARNLLIMSLVTIIYSCYAMEKQNDDTWLNWDAWDDSAETRVSVASDAVHTLVTKSQKSAEKKSMHIKGKVPSIKLISKNKFVVSLFQYIYDTQYSSLRSIDSLPEDMRELFKRKGVLEMCEHWEKIIHDELKDSIGSINYRTYSDKGYSDDIEIRFTENQPLDILEKVFSSMDDVFNPPYSHCFERYMNDLQKILNDVPFKK